MDESQGWVVKGVISRVHIVLGQTIRQHFLLMAGDNLISQCPHQILLGILNVIPGHWPYLYCSNIVSK